MDFSSFKILVNHKRKQNPVWFKLELDQPPSDKLLADAEKLLELKIPQKYKEFLLEFGGGYFALSNVYSLDEASDWYLVNLNSKYQDIRCDYILISENGCGDFYGFKISDHSCEEQLYFYDHEINAWSRTEYNDLFEFLAAKALSN